MGDSALLLGDVLVNVRSYEVLLGLGGTLCHRLFPREDRGDAEGFRRSTSAFPEANLVWQGGSQARLRR